MNVRQLEAFRAVMAHGTMTGAARVLGVSQPAVSQSIGQLERSCGFALFVRTGSRLLPTREAEAMLTEVQHLFAGVRRVSRVAVALREQRWGELSLGAFPAIAKRLLPDIIARYAAERPDVMFRLESMRSRSLIDAVANQQIDMALSVLPGDREEVRSIRLQKLQAVCIFPAGHRLSALDEIEATDLANEPFISLGLQDRSRMLIDKIFDDLQVPRRLQIETGPSEAAYAFVAAGAGVAVIDPLTVLDHLDPRVEVRPFMPEMTFSIWLLVPEATRRTVLAEHFAEFLRAGLVELASRTGVMP